MFKSLVNMFAHCLLSALNPVRFQTLYRNDFAIIFFLCKRKHKLAGLSARKGTRVRGWRTWRLINERCLDQFTFTETRTTSCPFVVSVPDIRGWECEGVYLR